MSWLVIAGSLVLWFLGVFFRVGGELIDLLLVVAVGLVLLEILPKRKTAVPEVLPRRKRVR